MVQMQAKVDLMQEQLSVALRNQNVRVPPEANQRVSVSPEENQNVLLPPSAGRAVEPEEVPPGDVHSPAPGGTSHAAVLKAAPKKPSPAPGEVSDARRTTSEDAEGPMRDGVGGWSAGSLAEVIVGVMGAEARRKTEEDAEHGSLRMGGRFRKNLRASIGRGNVRKEPALIRERIPELKSER